MVISGVGLQDTIKIRIDHLREVFLSFKERTNAICARSCVFLFAVWHFGGSTNLTLLNLTN